MIKEEDVITAYRMILGREPESQQAILSHLEFNSILELRYALLHSKEFKSIIT